METSNSYIRIDVYAIYPKRHNLKTRLLPTKKLHPLMLCHHKNTLFGDIFDKREILLSFFSFHESVDQNKISACHDNFFR